MIYIVLYVCIRDCIYCTYATRESTVVANAINQSHILNTSPRQVVVLTSYSYSVQQNIMPMHKITINHCDDSLYYIQAEQ